MSGKSKSKKRSKKISKARNIRRNQPKPKYRLDVKLGEWCLGAKYFYTEKEMDEFLDSQSEVAQKANVEIAEAVAVHIKSGKQVRHVKPQSIPRPEEIGV